MCTIGYYKDLNLIFKNRDKTRAMPEEVITGNGYVAVRTEGADYFSCGVNRYHCGFVSAAINSPRWTSLIYEGKVNEANEQFKLENRGLSNPMVLISEAWPDCREIDGIIDGIKSSGLRWWGYNILLADPGQALVVETYNSDIRIRRLGPAEVVTNHFLLLDFGPKHYSEYPSSFRRYEYGNNNIKSVESLSGLFNLLKPKEQADRKKIWREGPFRTVSSSVIDLKSCLMYYSKGLDEDYSVFRIRDAGQEAILTERKGAKR